MGPQARTTKDSLERIRLRLPLTAHFNPHLDTFVDLLRTTLIIHSELQHIAVLQRKRPTLCIGIRESHMVQKRSRAAFGILDEEFATGLAPDFCMGS